MSYSPTPEYANPAKQGGEAIHTFSPDAVTLDGVPIKELDPHEGAIVVESENNTNSNKTYYSLAATQMIFNAAETASHFAPGEVLNRRVGKISILEAPATSRPTYGVELESVTLNEYGDFVDSGTPDEMNETYRFQREVNGRPTDDPEELRRMYKELCINLAEDAYKKGVLAAPLSVFAHREPTREELNPNPYFLHTGDNLMAPYTGSETFRLFRMGGVQMHVSGDNTEAMLMANEAMAYLVPIMAAPSVAAPFVLGGLAEKFKDMERADLSLQQRKHFMNAGITISNFAGKHHSYRPLLRAASSPQANVQVDVAPESINEYLERGHKALAEGKIINIDRLFGMHRSRQRTILDQSGANTYEASDFDTFNGNYVIMPEMHLLMGAVYKQFEALALRGQDPREQLASTLGIADRTNAQRLRIANRYYVHQVGNSGNDAQLYRTRTPGEWLPTLFDIATAGGMSAQYKASILQKAFATERETRTGINHSRFSNSQAVKAYPSLNIGSASTYMLVQYEGLGREGINKPADRVRRIQRDIGKTFMHHAEQVA